MLEAGGLHSEVHLLQLQLGKSSLASPDYEEGILYAEVDKRTVLKNAEFDYSGHYSRPEPLNLKETESVLHGSITHP